jgi:4-hydroxy-4-methyl-2-oxoglutarate aldolase
LSALIMPDRWRATVSVRTRASRTHWRLVCLAAGILADGRLRDFAELEHYDLAIYCRGETTRWGGDTVTPYEANRPVVIGGVAIHPGDYVFADASGAAVIPAGDVRAVLHTANQVVAADAQSIVTIRDESPNILGDSET